MKFLKSIIVIIILYNTIHATAQERKYDEKLKSKETATKELKFTNKSPDNILVVDNIYGSIAVEGYNGETIKVLVTKTIYADNQEDIEKGKEEITIKAATKENAVYVYFDSPYSRFDLETGSFQYNEFNADSRRGYKHRKKRSYKFRLDYKIKVPTNTSIDLKAVNEGDIYAENIQGKLLIVNNINGAIDLKNVSGATDVNALNKDINIVYTNNPTEESFYHSLNGDINIKFKEGLDAEITYKTMNGKFYTNFDVEKTTPKLKKTSGLENKGTKYKIDDKEHFKIGKGSVALHFEQLNGDAILKK